MYPHERSLVRHLAGKPFAIVGVNSDADLEAIRKVTKSKQITWRSFWNGPDGTKGPISTQWSVASWPTTYLIDKDGVIRYKNVRGKSLDAALEVLMAEMGEEVSLVDIDHEAADAEALKADPKKTSENKEAAEPKAAENEAEVKETAEAVTADDPKSEKAVPETEATNDSEEEVKDSAEKKVESPK
jgi:hypothetical protein